VNRRLLATALVGALAATFAPSAGTAVPPAPPAASGVDYYYAAAAAYADSPAAGFQATLTVHKPRQVERAHRGHSLGQIAVTQTTDGSYLEAGWTQERGKPRLFVFWRPPNRHKTCYNLGCGFRLKGPGRRPGSKVKPGSTLTVGFEHVGRKWWFLVDGERSGYYPDRLWKGQFTSTDLAQVFGEVVVDRGHQPCTDMGTGQLPATGAGARIYDAAWIGGPPALTLVTAPSAYPSFYDIVQTAPNAVAYGGPGAC
jgi:hypothetical protein